MQKMQPEMLRGPLAGVIGPASILQAPNCPNLATFGATLLQIGTVGFHTPHFANVLMARKACGGCLSRRMKLALSCGAVTGFRSAQLREIGVKINLLV